MGVQAREGGFRKENITNEQGLGQQSLREVRGGDGYKGGLWYKDLTGDQPLA